MRGAVIASVAVLSLASCGRSSSLDRRDAEAWDAKPDAGAPLTDASGGDGSNPGQADGPARPMFDGPRESIKRDLPPTTPDASPEDTRANEGPPAETRRPDAPPAEVRALDAPPAEVGPVPDAVSPGPDSAPFSCASLLPLIEKGPLTNLHASKVLFAPDGKSILLLASSSAGTDGFDALLVSLPGGEQRILASQVKGAEWLGRSAVLLEMSADSALLAVTLEGKTLRSVQTPTCSHVATPDGSRVYYNHDCALSTGTASVLDIVTGETKQLATQAVTGYTTVSPGGRWIAHVVLTSGGDASASNRAVHVVDEIGSSYMVPIPESIRSAVFASDETLLLQSEGSDYMSFNIWRHALGTTETSLLAEGDPGYEAFAWNRDRSAFLLARFPTPSEALGDLSLVSVADGSLVQLASDLMDYRMFAMRINTFAMVPSSHRAIYIANADPDAARSYGVTAVGLDGEQRQDLGHDAGQALVSPDTDRVAVIAARATDSVPKVTVFSATTGAEQLAVEGTNSLEPLAFVPGDRGLLLVDYRTGEKKRQLQHLSFATGLVSTLAEWTSSNGLMVYVDPTGLQSKTYPVDPNGCFVPVDSDLDPQGTRLILLPE